MRKIYIACAALSLAGCGVNQGLNDLVNSPAPCSVSAVDEQTFAVALLGFDTALTAVDRLVAAKVIVPGSARAIQIADAVRAAKNGFKTARPALKACNSSSYLAALNDASLAVARINSLIKGN
jgi:hypothetical protein